MYSIAIFRNNGFSTKQRVLPEASALNPSVRPMESLTSPSANGLANATSRLCYFMLMACLKRQQRESALMHLQPKARSLKKKRAAYKSASKKCCFFYRKWD